MSATWDFELGAAVKCKSQGLTDTYMVIIDRGATMLQNSPRQYLCFWFDRNRAGNTQWFPRVALEALPQFDPCTTTRIANA